MTISSGRMCLLVLLLLLVGVPACSDGDETPIPTSSPGVLTISPDKLPGATVGQPYQATITVTGNRTPVGYIGVEGGALPAGLEIKYQQIQNTASISGVPQKAGTFKFIISTWCMGTNQPGQTARRDYELLVR